jgi:hypothetical protein
MTDKRIGRLYTKTIKKLRLRLKKSEDCMKRTTNNPDYIYMLGNKCIKPSIKKSRGRRTHKKYRINKHHNKSHKRRFHHKGGSLTGNLVNSANTFTAGLKEVQPPVSVLPWEDSFSRNATKL